MKRLLLAMICVLLLTIFLRSRVPHALTHTLASVEIEGVSIGGVHQP